MGGGQQASTREGAPNCLLAMNVEVGSGSPVIPLDSDPAHGRASRPVPSHAVC